LIFVLTGVSAVGASSSLPRESQPGYWYALIMLAWTLFDLFMVRMETTRARGKSRGTTVDHGRLRFSQMVEELRRIIFEPPVAS